jgi:hypothetical protein
VSRKNRGQSLLEFALGLTVVMLLFMGVFDLGFGIYQYITVSNMAREAARYAVATEHQPLSQQDFIGDVTNPRSNAAAIAAGLARGVALRTDCGGTGYTSPGAPCWKLASGFSGSLSGPWQDAPRYWEGPDYWSGSDAILTFHIYPEDDWAKRSGFGRTITATVTYKYRPITPLIPFEVRLTASSVVMTE